MYAFIYLLVTIFWLPPCLDLFLAQWTAHCTWFTCSVMLTSFPRIEIACKYVDKNVHMHKCMLVFKDSVWSEGQIVLKYKTSTSGRQEVWGEVVEMGRGQRFWRDLGAWWPMSKRYLWWCVSGQAITLLSRWKNIILDIPVFLWPCSPTSIFF